MGRLFLLRFCSIPCLFLIFPYIPIYTHMCVCVVCYFDVFQNSHSRSRGSKCYVTQGIRPDKSCSEASQVVVYIFHSKLCSHPYIHTYMHTHTFIDSLILFKDIYFDIQYCRVYKCYTSRGSKCLAPQGIHHINLAAKHPKLCTYFIQNSVHIHTYIHTYKHIY